MHHTFCISFIFIGFFGTCSLSNLLSFVEQILSFIVIHHSFWFHDLWLLLFFFFLIFHYFMLSCFLSCFLSLCLSFSLSLFLYLSLHAPFIFIPKEHAQRRGNTVHGLRCTCVTSFFLPLSLSRILPFLSLLISHHLSCFFLHLYFVFGHFFLHFCPFISPLFTLLLHCSNRLIYVGGR